MKKFLITGFIFLLVLSMFAFAQGDADIAVEDELLDEIRALDVAPLPDETGDIVAPTPDIRVEAPEEDLFTTEGLEFEMPEELPPEEEEELGIPSAMVAGPAAGFIILYLVMVIVLIGIMIAAFVFWIWMLVDCAKRKFRKENEKVVWILIIVLVGLIGSIIYYFVVKRKAKKRRR